MTGVGDTPRDFPDFVRDTRTRLVALERRQGGGGSGGGGSGGSYAAEPGLVSAFAGGAIPSGWLLCDGQAVSRVGYPELYGKIGTTYGAGDGSTTFNVPDLRGRAIFGLDATQTEFDTLGEAGGAKTHRHAFRIAFFDKNWQGAGPYAAMLNAANATDNDRAGAYRYSDGKYAGASGPDGTSSTTQISSVTNGATSSVNTTLGRYSSTGDTDVPSGTTGLPPYRVLNYIISTGAGVGGGGSTVPALPETFSWGMNGSVTVTEAAAAWHDIDAAAQVTFTLSYPLRVLVIGAAHITAAASTYGMVGVQATGALNLEPEVGLDGSASKYGYAAWGEAATSLGGKMLVFHKPLLLPAGTTTLKLRKRRNVTTGVPTIGYPTMTVIPQSWVGAPGPVAVPFMQKGTVQNAASVAVGGLENIPITFPVPFATPPAVMFTGRNGRVVCALNGLPTTTGCTLQVNNWSTGALPAASLFEWTAIAY